MNRVQDIVWLSESLSLQLAVELQALLEDWTRSWGLPKAGDVLPCPSLAGVAPLPPDVIDLLAPASSVWRSTLAQDLLKARADSPIAEGVVRRVVSSLHELLQRSFAVTAAASSETAWPTQPGHQGIAFSVALIGQRCGLFLANSALRSSGRLRRPEVPAPPAVRMEHVMASLPVPLIAQLGNASLSVTELLQLAPGDVLVLNENLASPLCLVSPGSSLSLQAHLGAAPDSNRRAARFVATH